MNRSHVPKFVLIPAFIFIVLVPISFIVMALWNNILAAVLPVSQVNFWQALGLFALCRILFGGFPGRPGWGGHRGNRRDIEEMRNKWFNLSPEERKNFKAKMKGGFKRETGSETPDTTVSTGTE